MKSSQSVDVSSLRVGYVPISASLNCPGDKRRFAYYANKRNLNFEIADPSRKYDVVVLTQSADLSVWSQCEIGGAKIVYDLIDSYLAIPRYSLKGLLRGLAKYLSGQSQLPKLNHWKAIGEMCSRADAVVCSTQEQSADISRFCDNVHIILDFHKGVARMFKSNFSAHRPFRLVWEGLPQNISSLKLLRCVLDQLHAFHPLEVHIVTDPTYNLFLGKYGKTKTLNAAKQIFPDIHFHEWNESDCADVICSCDLAVIPLNLKDPFAAGKPENKLLLLWRMAMPVVTSASPAYSRAMHAAGLNYSAKGDSDWLAMLRELICNPVAREQAGVRGKAYVDNQFSEEILMARWDAMFDSLKLTTTDS